MPSMYETILELPLFKGIGEELLSALLEKTSIEFCRFDSDDIIATPEDNVNAISFIIGGNIRVKHRLKNFNIAVIESHGKGAMIGALHLYGLDTTYGAYVSAIDRVNLMRISKKDYMEILMRDKIFILNFVNYLSASAQRPSERMKSAAEASIERTLLSLVNSFVSRNAESVCIQAEECELARFCGVDIADFRKWKLAAIKNGLIEESNLGILIKNCGENR